MKPPVRFRVAPAGLVLAFLATSAGSLAQTDDDFTLDRNRIWAGARFALNVKMDFRSIQTPASATAPTYDDGYVYPDISGSTDGLTWNWGMDTSTQVPLGTDLEMHIVTGSPRDGLTESTREDPQAGFELLYGRVLGFLPVGRDRQMAWGLLGGFGSLDINGELDDTVLGTVRRATYSYSLGGIVAPSQSYHGTEAGPGPTIPLPSPTPAGTSAVVAAASEQRMQMDAMLIGFKLAPFVELPLSDRWVVNVSAGLAAMDAQVTMRFDETITVTGTGGSPATRKEEYQEDTWLLGFYGGARVSYALNYGLSVFVGGQYMHLGDASVAGGGKEATLQMGNGFEVTAGFRASF